jgi:FkbM family methyltransferase
MKAASGRSLPKLKQRSGMDESGLEELSKTMGENALLQAKVNEALARHVLKLEQMVQQGQANLSNSTQYLAMLVREAGTRLDQLNERISSNGPVWGRVAVPAGSDLWLTKVLDRFLMYVEMRDMSVAPFLTIEGRWEPVITKAFIERMKPGMVVVDVGANYGYYSLLAGSYVGWDGRSSTGGKVYSFEPNPRTFEILKKNIHVNWLTSVIQAFPFAALDARKKIELHVLREFQGGTSLFSQQVVPEADPPSEERPLVDAVPLDEIITEKVDLMKIDSEGSEPLVFDGMRGILERNRELTIFMEFNLPMLTHTLEPREFLNRIRNRGFSILWFTPWGTLEPFAEETALQYPMFNLLLERN